jgi:L-fucose mutarotase/ribose pyranase (RbsD/FucU family)
MITPRHYGRAVTLTLIAVVITGCSTPKAQTPAEPWQQKLTQSLSVMGHRNWIVVADSAYPAQSSQAIETIATDDDHFRVLEWVLKALDKAPHVTPKIYLDSELRYIPEKDAPGIDACRTRLSNILAGRAVTYTPHIESIETLNKMARIYNVLVLKTSLALPYTSVFMELDCAYWNPQAEQNLRTIMKNTLPSP